VGRLVVQSLGSSAWDHRQQQQQQQPMLDQYHECEEEEEDETWRGMAALLLQLRMAVQDKRCAAVVTCQACESGWVWGLKWGVRL